MCYCSMRHNAISTRVPPKILFSVLLSKQRVKVGSVLRNFPMIFLALEAGRVAITGRKTVPLLVRLGRIGLGYDSSEAMLAIAEE